MLSELILVRFSSFCGVLYVIIDTHMNLSNVSLYYLCTYVLCEISKFEHADRGRAATGILTSHSLALNTTLVDSASLNRQSGWYTIMQNIHTKVVL